MEKMSELVKIDEIEFDRNCFEYSSSTIKSSTGNEYQSKCINVNEKLKVNSKIDSNLTNISKEKSIYMNTSMGSQNRNDMHASTSNPYGDNLLNSTLNQIDKEHVCNKSYFDHLPPEIEISVYGTETLPENSVLETENVFNTSGAETDTTINNNTLKNRKNFKTRYITIHVSNNFIYKKFQDTFSISVLIFLFLSNLFVIFIVKFSKSYFQRCLKPNHERISNQFDEELIREQLKYNGIIDIAYIRNQGWPVRLTFEDFLNKYLNFFSFLNFKQKINVYLLKSDIK